MLARKNVVGRLTNLCAIIAVTCSVFGHPFVVSAVEAGVDDHAQFSNDKPNVIIIYTDDQGFGDASCLNPDAKFKTPNIDRLAREGISFRNGHSADTVCTPSRYALLTGRYCWRTTKKTGVLGAEATCLITEDRLTIASMLRDQGYDTAMVGKWHLGMDFPGESDSRDWSQPVKDMPLDKGFDFYFGIPASLNYGVLAWFEGRRAKVPPTLFTNKKPNQRHLDYRIKPPYEKSPDETKQLLGKNGFEVASDFVDQDCLTRFTDVAIDWMDGKISKSEPAPFFLYLPLTSPHYPVCPLPEFWNKGNAGGYGEFMIETDYHVGRILDFLDQKGIAENTLVIFTSDNGPEKSWKQRIEEYDHDSRGGFRGGKRDIYEGGHRVPFFIRWPKGIEKPGREYDGLVGQVDLLATIAEIVGVEMPDQAAEDSCSFASVLAAGEAELYKRLPLINHAANGQFSVTDGNWKLVMPHGKKGAELFDLASDPMEKLNLAEANPTKVTELTEKITQIVILGRTTKGQAQANDTGYWKDLKWLKAKDYGVGKTLNKR